MKEIGRNIPEAPEYTLAETIAEIEAWMNGGRMYPVEVAVSALYWLERASPAASKEEAQHRHEVIVELAGWLNDSRPNLPDVTARGALQCLLEVLKSAAGERNNG